MTILPRKNVLIGITHQLTESGDVRKVIHEPKVLKVGIGYPKGKAADVYVDPDGNWCIRCGKKGSDGLEFATARIPGMKDGTPIPGARQAAEVKFKEAWEKAAVVNYPRKVGYFLFTRPLMVKGEEVYWPDFEAIEAYSFRGGAIGAPTEIDVIFIDDECFSGSYAMWSASECQCSGDGDNASRSVAMYKNASQVPEQLKEAWSAAQKAGDRQFPVIGGCWTHGCPYSKEFTKGDKLMPSPCKPSADLRFQLVNNLRVGGTAFFHTSGIRSIAQTFSAVERIKQLTGGRIAGIPLKMVLRPYKTMHNGQAAQQFGVSLEFRAESMRQLQQKLMESVTEFRQMAGVDAPIKMLEAGVVEESQMSAKAMTDEFYPGTDPDDVTEAIVAGRKPEPETVSGQAAAASNDKVTNIADALNKSAAAVEASTGEKAPWGEDRKAMTTALMEMRTTLGDEKFKSCLGGIMLGGADPKDPAVLTAYLKMKAMAGAAPPPAAAPATAAAAAAQDDSPF